jgi:hypothetical protein
LTSLTPLARPGHEQAPEEGALARNPRCVRIFSISGYFKIAAADRAVLHQQGVHCLTAPPLGS